MWKMIWFRDLLLHDRSPNTRRRFEFFLFLLLRSLFLKLGGEEVEYDPGFQLYLQTKLSNPHYKPEIAAQVRRMSSAILIDDTSLLHRAPFAVAMIRA